MRLTILFIICLALNYTIVSSKCLDECMQCGPNDQCLKCIPTKFLVLGDCYGECPMHYYFDQNQECFMCNDVCDECSSADSCDTCAGGQFPPTCLCRKPFVQLNNKCLNQCPLYYENYQLKGNCKRQCPLSQYPLEDTLNSTQCVTVTSTYDDFCLQHLSKMETQIKFSLQTQKDKTDAYTLFVEVSQTPLACYQYLLFGKDTYQIQQNDTQNKDDSFILSFNFNKSDLLNSEYFNCGTLDCDFQLKVQWGNHFQFIYKTKVNLSITGTLTSEFTLNGDSKDLDIACEDCQIPVDKVILSSIKINCLENQVCGDNSVSSRINTIISVTQTIDDPIFSKAIVQPHSLKFQLKDDQGNLSSTIYIRKFNFDNSKAGQITYSFLSFGVTNGQIIVTSVIKSTKSGRMLADSLGSSNVKYPQMAFDFKIISDDKGGIEGQSNENGNQGSSENNSTTYIIIIVALAVALTIAIGGYCMYKKMKGVKQQKANQARNNNNQIVDQEAVKQIQATENDERRFTSDEKEENCFNLVI